MVHSFFYKRLGEKIVTERRKRGISQDSLAYDLKIDRTYLSRLENGRANPSVEVIKKLSNKFKMSMTKFIGSVERSSS